jgi:hypothetical protein
LHPGGEKKKQLKTIKQKTDFSGDERKIIFRHGRAPGDNIMFTAGIRDFCLLFPEFRVGVHKKYSWIWENNPYIDHSLKKGDKDAEYYEVGYPAVGYCNNTNVHFTQMFLLDMIAITELSKGLPLSLGEFCAAFANGQIGDPRMGGKKGIERFKILEEKFGGFCKEFARQKGDLHLSQEEMDNNLVADAYGHEKYWIVAPGGKSDFTAKQWDWDRFQKVVDYFDGLIKFVVVGSKKAQMYVQTFDGAIDLIDKFNGDRIRGLVSLVYHAEGVISTPSLLMHMGAGVPKRDGRDKPGITIWGGREPTAWSSYCSYQHLHTNASFSCCKDGGCWKARTIPVMKHPEKNTSLCKFPVDCDGKTIQACMDAITAEDVIRAIEKYYVGDLYHYEKKDKEKKVQPPSIKSDKIHVSDPALPGVKCQREINLIGNLNSKGGGEQSLVKIGQVLQDAGWKVTVYPAKHAVHDNYKNCGLAIDREHSLENANIQNIMKSGIPLLFYANDSTRMFVDNGQEIVDKSSAVIIGINYVNRPLCDCRWLSNSGKLKAVVFQNREKLLEWDRDEVGYEGLNKYVLFGAIELDRFLEVCPPERKKDEPLVILRHSLDDYRKYVTTESHGKGEKIHIWQKHFDKDKDTKFYSRFLKDIKNIRFEFMKAHKELREFFKGDDRMVFHEWNAMPVTEFLARGHVWLYRTSNLWRDNYPRVHAEAMAAGLPTIVEPRDGTYERMCGGYGDRGFICVHYDGFKLALRTLQRKEGFRKDMGLEAKEWSRKNLDPRRWVRLIEDIIDV